jgi:two-component system, OmpR family, response regulator
MERGVRRVLVIEDDHETAEHVADCLSQNSYSVDVAMNGGEGLNRAVSTDYLVMTVDRLLPGIDGLEVIRRAREQRICTPALILSALGEIDDRVRGLRAGGDDYLVKPSTADASDHPLLVGNGRSVFLSWLTRREGYRLLPLPGTS